MGVPFFFFGFAGKDCTITENRSAWERARGAGEAAPQYVIIPAGIRIRILFGNGEPEWTKSLPAKKSG
jgi:hypothetical protein